MKPPSRAVRATVAFERNGGYLTTVAFCPRVTVPVLGPGGQRTIV